ncbi:MAG: tyramine oxidase [Acidimicrobiia bacterium]|nr:tyramine oxidase [Acidimicrobiia bacterium]
MGYFGIEEDAGRRLAKAICYAPSGSSNYWGRPIEGLIAVVDLDERELIRIIDTGPLPIPAGSVDLDEEAIGAARQAPNAISIVQKDGPSFEMKGRQVSWQKWRFHYRLDPRLGAVVSLVSYEEDEKRRSVLYQGSLSEVFIPYMDPDVGWGFRTYLDAGENGVGRLAVPLEPDFDCPSNAVFIDAVFAADTGEPVNHPRAACIYERFSGDIAWRHYESIGGQTNVRPRTDLVVRSISAIGNYDYIFDWVFRQDGTVRVDVGATGIPQVKAVDEDGSGSHEAYGHLVAEHTVAVNHDHFFSFRLDVDVDGTKNSFVSDELVPEEFDSPDGRKSVWVVESTEVGNEQGARRSIDNQRPAQWRFINPNVEGALGNPAGYELKPGANAVSLLSQDDSPQQRAGFTNHHLWVTPYDPSEIYAAGTYPNQSVGGEGLPAWTAQNRSITDSDLVAWYTLGFHHAPRAEDWPVTPTIWLDFELRPFDFFDRNPALDIPAGR